jgi:hypothetical protein
MDDYLGAIGRGLKKVFLSLFLYLAGSLFIMVLTSSLMTGRFPPPIFEYFQQLRNLSGMTKTTPLAESSETLGAQEMTESLDRSIALLKEDFANVSPAKRKQLRETIKVMEKMKAKIHGEATRRALESPTNSSQPSLAETMDRLKNHNQALEEAYHAAGGGSGTSAPTTVTTVAVANKAPAAASPSVTETNQEMQKMRFELDVLKSQMLYSRQEIERLKARARGVTTVASPADTRPTATQQWTQQKQRTK